MSLDESVVGQTAAPVQKVWNSNDALLYALGVGAGQVDALDELEFTTDNTDGKPQQVLPTFANLVFADRLILPDGVDRTKMLHAEQSFELYDPLPVEGAAETTGSITGVYDKGAGALLTNEWTATDSAGHTLGRVRATLFFRGYGGFGGPRGDAAMWEKPTGRPDHVVTYDIPADQALLYRLNGDRNPMHSDPSFSSRGGFPRPILHGMCTYGYTGRALLHAVADSETKRFRAMSGRFTKPILPGQSITVSMWVDGTDVRYQSTDESGAVVLDHGTATVL